MLSQEDNELVTNTNRGTPTGDLFRRFWLPVALSEELPGPDSVPVRVRALGEDLIAFRDTDGRVGLIDAYCAHRGAPLFFGRNEEQGLRCVYHGWKYDVDGNCTDLPNSPEGDTYKLKIKIKRYPVVEKGDLIWAYMGPADKMPPMPGFEWLDMPSSHRYVTKWRLECNYLQAMEGDYDQTHAPFLHSTLDNANRPPSIRGAGAQQQNIQGQMEDNEPFPRAVGRRRVRQLPWGNLEDAPGGVWHIAANTQPDGKVRANLRVNWYFPLFCPIGLAGPNTNAINIRIPIDNEAAWLYRLRWSYSPIPQAEVDDYKFSGYSYPSMIPGTYIPRDNVSNDYNIDRVTQRSFSYTGIKAFSTQDVALIEHQWGPIADRTQEHLAASDEQIIYIRRRIIRAARDLMNGTEPPEAFRPEAYRYHSASVTLDSGTEAEAIAQVREKAKEPNSATTRPQAVAPQVSV
jgi:phenylpropionate dioxygenase-like ring-hydroxylating dioxygenase large terminal subunit